MTATPARQPEEHIIIDSDFKQIYEIEYHLTCEERRAICERSRPHTSPPAPALDENTWNPTIHGYCGDLQRVKTELEELKMVNAMLEAEVDRLTGIESEAAKAAREQAETTDNIIAVLKKRYRKEMAILDYIEMIECEVVSLKVESLRAQQEQP